MRSLNLASRPFRNERLPTVLALLSLAAALLVSVYHVFLVRDVMPDRTSALIMQLGEMENESTRLRSEATSFVVDRPDKDTLARWTQLKDLVDKRVFSWSGLFAVLEDTLPNGVRLQTLAPSVKKGKCSLRITAVARTVDEALEFMRALEERPEFEQVWPNSRGNGEEGFSYQYEMNYLPESKAAPSPAPSSSGEPSPAGAVASAQARAVER